MGATPVLLLSLYFAAVSQAAAILSSPAKLILEQERAHERDLLDDELLEIEASITAHGSQLTAHGSLLTTAHGSRALGSRAHGSRPTAQASRLTGLTARRLPKPKFSGLRAKPKLFPKPKLLPTVAMRILEQEPIDEAFLLEQELLGLESVLVVEKPKFLPLAAQLILEQESAHESALLDDELDALEHVAEQAGATFLPILARLTLEQERAREHALLEDELAGIELQNPASSWPEHDSSQVNSHCQSAPEQKQQTHTWVENCTLAFIYGLLASVLLLYMPSIKSKAGK